MSEGNFDLFYFLYFWNLIRISLSYDIIGMRILVRNFKRSVAPLCLFFFLFAHTFVCYTWVGLIFSSLSSNVSFILHMPLLRVGPSKQSSDEPMYFCIEAWRLTCIGECCWEKVIKKEENFRPSRFLIVRLLVTHVYYNLVCFS